MIWEGVSRLTSGAWGETSNNELAPMDFRLTQKMLSRGDFDGSVRWDMCAVEVP